MKYSENADYLLSAIIYLSSTPYWWGRTPKDMAAHLCLDEQRLHTVLVGFPGIFRKSHRVDSNGQNYFSVQARFALYDSKEGEEPHSDSDIRTLKSDELKLLLDFVQNMINHEVAERRGWITNGIAVVAAISSALTAILVAVLKTCY